MYILAKYIGIMYTRLNIKFQIHIWLRYKTIENMIGSQFGSLQTLSNP